jgi:tetratricopeptide (TPR) repeat protein
MNTNKLGRNDPCHCKSGRKFKRCCGLAQPGSPRASLRAEAARRHCARAARLREEGKLEASVTQLQRAALEDPTNPHIQIELGIGLAKCNRLEESLASFVRATELEPRLAAAHFCTGAVLLDLGREREAVAPLQRAAALAPNVAEVQRILGGLLADWGWTRPAAAAFRAAAAASSSPALALYDTAMAQYTEGHLTDAKATMLRAKACDSNDVQIALKLAFMCAEEGQFAEAERELRSVLARDPRQANAAFHLFQAVRAKESDRPLLAELAAQAARPDVTANARMMFGFALGQAHDHLEEYAEAIRHFDVANEIRGSMAPLDRMALACKTEKLIRTFPVGSLDLPTAESPDADDRAIFIVGLPRSGTTLAEQILSSHPRVTAGGELTFWSANERIALEAGATEAALEPLAAGYRAVFDGIDPSAKRITDKNPFNFFRLGVICRALPRARVVHVRRTPIDNVLSLYTTYLSARYNFFFGNPDDLLFFYDAYVHVMEHWRTVLPPERFIEIDYESLVEDREAQTRRLVEFCGVEWNDACLRPEENDRAIRTASLLQARQPVYRRAIGRWRNYAPWLGPLMRVAPREPVERARQ